MLGKKILVLGGTGAMGIYTVPELLKKGYEVDVVTLDSVESDNEALSYITGDGKNLTFLKKLLCNKYNGIIDFLTYGTAEFKERYELLLSSTEHYIFLSSYRVYANEQIPITESAPRMLDVSNDKEYLSTEDYSLYKARAEDILFASNFNNWTIVRPAITYSKYRYQFMNMEADLFLPRVFAGKKIIVPEQALDIQCTLSWGGDMAKLFANLIFKKDAMGEAFNLSTAEHNSWRTIAEYYNELIGLEYVAVDKEDYMGLFEYNKYNRYQLEYDRMFERVMDNSKILKVTGLKQSDFMTVKEGLKMELEALPKNYKWNNWYDAISERMDEYLKNL